MRILPIITTLSIVGASCSDAVTFYSTNKLTQSGDSTTRYAGSSRAWDTDPNWELKPGTAAANQDTNGDNDPYAKSGNELVIQPGHLILSHRNKKNSSTVWQCDRVRLHGSIAAGQKQETTSTFNADIHVEGNESSWLIGDFPTTVNGTGKLLLGNKDILFNQISSGSAGSLHFELPIIGDGTVSFKYIDNSIGSLHFSEITQEFTGTFDASLGNDVTLRFSENSDTSKATLQLGRKKGDRHLKLNLAGSLHFHKVAIQDVVLASGSYSYHQLIELGTSKGLNFANNLIDNGGTLTVGTSAAAPSPAGKRTPASANTTPAAAKDTIPDGHSLLNIGGVVFKLSTH